MKLGRTMKGLALAGLATMSLAGCAADTGIVENSSLAVAQVNSITSFNSLTTNGNVDSNGNLTYLMQSSFNYYDDQTALHRNEQFGTYELISQDPMVVKYTINKGVTWSDGVAVDAADLLLNWAAQSGVLNTITANDAPYDPETYALGESGEVYFDCAAIGGGLEEVSQVPVIGDGGRSITMTYDKPMVDWEILFTSAGMPAHIVGEHALGLTDAQAAKDAVIAAIQNDDEAALIPLSYFWSTGFDYVSMPEDTSVTVGNGAYVVTDFTDQYITLTARGAAYHAGPQPKIESITIRNIPDSLAEVQALANGEVSIIMPQASSDTVAAIQALDGVTMTSQPGLIYEHIDLTFNNGGPFDPAAYNGDDATALLVRKAFLTAIDVNDMVNKLIKPLDPTVTPLMSQVFLKGIAGYEGSVAKNGSSAYGQGDAEAAAAMLTEAGVTTPIDVCFMWNANNSRRNQEYPLYVEDLAPAGFNLVDCSDPSWSARLGDGSYDAVLFGWIFTSMAVTSSQGTFDSTGGNNFSGYNSPAVDDLFTQLSGEFDHDAQVAILQDIDKQIFADAYGIPLFQEPGIMAYDSSLSNVSASPLSPQFFWNFWEWEAPATTTE